MRKSAGPPPPAQLSREARSWWRTLTATYLLDDPSLFILENALESFDRMRQAQAIIEKDGITITDRFGQPKQHPATLVERDAKMALLRQLKALNLDLEPLHDRPGRPAGK